MNRNSLKRQIILTAGVAAIMAVQLFVGAKADDFGDAYKGRELAVRVCAECHAVGKEAASSPKPAATPFKDVADLPSTTRTALTVWLRSPHKEMPDLILGAEDTDNVIAYILSLKERP